MVTGEPRMSNEDEIRTLIEFPLALVPTFLVPLAFALHVVSLWQLFGGTWVPRRSVSFARSR